MWGQLLSFLIKWNNLSFLSNSFITLYFGVILRNIIFPCRRLVLTLPLSWIKEPQQRILKVKTVTFTTWPHHCRPLEVSRTLAIVNCAIITSRYLRWHNWVQVTKISYIWCFYAYGFQSNLAISQNIIKLCHN